MESRSQIICQHLIQSNSNGITILSFRETESSLVFINGVFDCLCNDRRFVSRWIDVNSTKNHMHVKLEPIIACWKWNMEKKYAISSILLRENVRFIHPNYGTMHYIWETNRLVFVNQSYHWASFNIMLFNRNCHTFIHNSTRKRNDETSDLLSYFGNPFKELVFMHIHSMIYHSITHFRFNRRLACDSHIYLWYFFLFYSKCHSFLETIDSQAEKKITIDLNQSSKSFMFHFGVWFILNKIHCQPHRKCAMFFPFIPTCSPGISFCAGKNIFYYLACECCLDVLSVFIFVCILFSSWFKFYIFILRVLGSNL